MWTVRKEYPVQLHLTRSTRVVFINFLAIKFKRNSPPWRVVLNYQYGVYYYIRFFFNFFRDLLKIELHNTLVHIMMKQFVDYLIAAAQIDYRYLYKNNKNIPTHE